MSFLALAICVLPIVDKGIRIMMENQVNEQTVTSPENGSSATGYNSGIWDGLSVVALIGGAIASVVLPANPAAGVIPVAAGVGLHLFNRKQLEEHLLANQRATVAQIVQLVNQNQAHLQEYLQKFQGDIQTSLGQQQQAIAANQENLTKALAEKSLALQGKLEAFQAAAAQTHAGLDIKHQDLLAVVTELRTMEGCTQSLAAYPHAEAYYQRGLSHYRLEDWAEAVRDCTEAIRLRGIWPALFTIEAWPTLVWITASRLQTICVRPTSSILTRGIWTVMKSPERSISSTMKGQWKT
ncbi:tetratricopeptide repeat protein [Synechocystis sp. B12]|nr:tetratricopeptide repeat protein [Synechocystis sp. B12]